MSEGARRRIREAPAAKTNARDDRLALRRPRAAAFVLALAVTTLAVLLQPPASNAYASYSTAQFHISTNSYAFGQAPVFMPDGRVVFSKDFEKGAGMQVYIARRDGSQLRCLTCGLPAPNAVPAVRPQGDWILFHSWMGHRITLGVPGYGGIGSELYAMRPDGSHVTKLYELSAANQFGEGDDDYHAYFSPDGKRIVWAHLGGNFIAGERATWDVRVASFVVRGGTPTLTNVRIVRPPNGHWYETQWWAPDGSGFLYTESYGTAMNTELFFCRLPKSGPCRVTRLTDSPAWDEQALFTPDMKGVIFMSSRDHPGFYNTFTQLTQDLGLPNTLDNLLVLPIFELGFLQPLGQERTDLYELDLRTRALRRLTTDGNDGWITPEFTWDPSNRQLFWTENRLPPGLAVPLPLDLGDQVRATVAYLMHPRLDLAQSISSKNVLNTVLPIEQRTRLASFAGACGCK